MEIEKCTSKQSYGQIIRHFKIKGIKIVADFSTQNKIYFTTFCITIIGFTSAINSNEFPLIRNF